MGWLPVVALALAGGALIAVVVAAAARQAFHSRIETLQRSVEQAPSPSGARTNLPAGVLALAQRLGVSATGGGRLVRLTQSGEMWLKPGSKPLAFTAQQTIAVAEAGFLWRAWFPMMTGLSMQVIDYLAGGEGGLEVRLPGALPVVRATGGDAMFRGEAMRYLSELMWNPDALLFNRQLEWRVVDAHTLAVTVGEGARRSEVRLILDAGGELVRVEADDRPRLDGGEVSTCPWFGRGNGYRMIGSQAHPDPGEAGWIIDGAEFIYWRGHVESWSAEV